MLRVEPDLQKHLSVGRDDPAESGQAVGESRREGSGEDRRRAWRNGSPAALLPLLALGVQHGGVVVRAAGRRGLRHRGDAGRSAPLGATVPASLVLLPRCRALLGAASALAPRRRCCLKHGSTATFW